MVKIVSKHYRVLDAANELMWTCVVEEAQAQSLLLACFRLCGPDGGFPTPAAHPGRPPVGVTPLVEDAQEPHRAVSTYRRSRRALALDAPSRRPFIAGVQGAADVSRFQ